jgi:hypothetical protein
MKRATYPLFSPDLAPSEYYRFVKVKTALHCAIFQNENELLARVSEVLMDITWEELKAVFDEWLRRLNACIQRQEDYVK